MFCLQAQDEIANRRLLFHRQGEQFVPAAIRDVLPYFLGAVDEDHLLTLKRYQDARARLRKLEREYADAQSVTNEASNAAASLLQEARRVGLAVGTSTATQADEVRHMLREAIVPKNMMLPAVDDPKADISELEERRRSSQRRLQELREEISDIERLSKEATEFEEEAREQQARLAPIGLIRGKDSSDRCPVCESHLEVPVPTISQIKKSLSDITRQLASVRRDAPRLQERLAKLEAQRSAVSEEIRAIQRDIAQRIQENERLRIEQNQFLAQARVAGRIGYYLENTVAVSPDGGLLHRLNEVRAQVSELQQALDGSTSEERLATALNLVGRDLTAYAAQLGLEHGENPLRLDIKRLTVIADTDAGPLALAQMGSGENWVGYHVAAHLSLHKLFRRRNRPVPGFLMLDQPSQAHYPPEKDNEGKLDELADEDQAAVHQLFALLHEYTQKLEPRMQIIVADHVELLDGWFRECIVERWRDGIALVPQSWGTE